LRESEQKLKALNATKDKLFTIIAHDLKNPFNSILGFSELLLENLREYDIFKTEKFVKNIGAVAKNTLNLLENLLDWAKTQTGQISFSPEKLDLTTIIAEIIELLNSAAQIKNITLNYLQIEPVSIYADANMIKTILRNLISNAIKYTNSSGKVFIYAIPSTDHIEITVSDNGLGMSEDVKNNLFTDGEQTSLQGTTGEKGTGLGLLICKDFVEKHGGKIWAESDLGKGSTFKFTLPVLSQIN